MKTTFSPPERTLQYRIGGIVLRLRGTALVESSARWEVFSDLDNTAALEYWVAYCKRLPSFEGATRCGRILLCRSGATRRFYLGGTDEAYACVTEPAEKEARQFEIRILDKFRPWGRNAEQLFSLMALHHTLLPFRRLLLHGAYITAGSAGILFTGPSGIGKTTQARLWNRCFGAESVNEDRAIIGIDSDSVRLYGVPVAGSSPVCRSIDAPLKAVIVLEQGLENSISPLRPAQAISRLMDGSYIPPAFAEDKALALDIAAEIAGRTPVWLLRCRPDEDSARLAHRTIFGF